MYKTRIDLPTYRATLHTLEIKPQLSEGTTPEAWHRMVVDMNHSCIDRMHRTSDGSYSIIINPHKLHRADDGHFIFTYRSLKDILQDMKTICNGIGIEDYSLKRVDICLDTDTAYCQTHKLAQLIMLMLADEHSLSNRYESRDPLTLEVKSSTLSNGRRYDASLEMEHYTRDQLIRLCQCYDASATPNLSRVDNLLAKDRFGSCFELFTFREIQAVTGRMQDALKGFMGSEFSRENSPLKIIKFDDF